MNNIPDILTFSCSIAIIVISLIALNWASAIGWFVVCVYIARMYVEEK